MTEFDDRELYFLSTWFRDLYELKPGCLGTADHDLMEKIEKARKENQNSLRSDQG